MVRMSWVANELVCDGERFYMECVREPPEWFLWYKSKPPSENVNFLLFKGVGQ